MNREDEQGRVPKPGQRIGGLVLAALLLYLLFKQCEFFASPSERFHATVPLLWLLDALAFRKLYTQKRWRYMAAATVGGACGLLLFLWRIAALQAQMAGGSTDWREPCYKLSLIASDFVLYALLASGITRLLQCVPAVKALLTAPRGWWLRLLRGALTFLLFAPYLFTSFNIHRFKIANVGNPQTALHLPYESVSFRAAKDGVLLSGWFIPSPHSDATVVVCHGIGANKSNFLSIVPFLHRAGFNVLIFDFRGHGDSAGHTTSFGFYEARDVEGAVRYLHQRSDSHHIVAYGFSMGGAALLHAIPHLPEVRGVVVDSTFADFAPVARGQMSFLPSGVDTVLLAATDFYGRLELGVSMGQIASRPYIAAVSPRPLLIIHGTADALIPPSEAQTNFAAAHEPKELWLVKGAGHCECWAVATADYERRVAQFFRRCL